MVLCYIRIMTNLGTSWWGEYMAQYNEAATFVRGCKVLDIGCGVGFGTRSLFDRGAIECLGVDRNGDDILQAQKENGRDGVSFIAADAKGLPFAPKSFDVITCFQVLESTTSCDQVLEQIKRLLTPTGTAIFTTVNRRRDDHPHSTPAFRDHVQEFDRDELKLLLKRSFGSCEMAGLVSKRSSLMTFLSQNKTLEFVKDRLENQIPWKLREVVSQRVFKTSYYPAMGDFSLTELRAREVPLFFAVCRP
jgi:ubiquinone/menaquinone biosynthesis C-methylase UbiE